MDIKDILNRYNKIQSNVTKKILAEHPDEFNNFFSPFLSFFEDDLEAFLKALEKRSSFRLSIDNLLFSSLNSLLRDLFNMSIKTLITVIHSCKSQGILVGETSEKRYEYFNELLERKEVIEEILDAYPVLSLLISIKISSKLEFLKETLDNVSGSFDSIKDKLNIGSDTLRSIKFSLGDLHNNGKEVLIFTFDEDFNFVYKPNNIEIYKIFEDIIDWYNLKPAIKHKLDYVKTLSFNNFYIQEYIENKDCTSIEEVNEYYYKIGMQLFICYLLKTTDIHSENIIAKGNNPYIIDIETLVNNDNPQIFGESFMKTFLENINESVLGSMILPQNYDRASFDVDISGLSGDGSEQSKNMETFALINKGTDNIMLEKQYVSMGKHKNILMLNGNKVDILDYYNLIIEGFRDSYNLQLDEKDSFMELLNTFVELNPKFRQILRPTFVYGKFIDASYHPQYLKSTEDRSKLLSIMLDETEQKHMQMSKKTKREIEELYYDNVPYFKGDFNTKNLYFGNDESIHDYFEKSIYEIIEDRIKGIDFRDLEKQSSYIRQSLVTSNRNIWKGTHGAVLTKGNLKHRVFTGDSDFLGCSKDIGEYLISTAVKNKNTKSSSWMTLLISNDEQLKLGPLNHLLYEGGGVFLFIAYLYNETSDERYRTLLYESLKGLREIYHLEYKDQPLSAFSGVGSLLYIYYNISVLLRDDELYSIYLSYVDMLEEYQLNGDDLIYDFLGGLAGMIELCLNIYEEDKNEKLLTFAKRCAVEVISHIKNDDTKFLTGLSHGYSGFSLPLLHLSKLANDKELYDFGIELINEENRFYQRETNNWMDLRENIGGDLVFWCHGAAGVGLSRTLALKYVLEEHRKLIEEDMFKAVEKIKNSGLRDGFNHSLCHGLFGNIDIMLNISQKTQDKSIYAFTLEKAKEILQGACGGGLEYGLKNTTDFLSGLLGLSGIGIALLRIINPVYPSVLSLEIIKRGDLKDETKG